MSNAFDLSYAKCYQTGLYSYLQNKQFGGHYLKQRTRVSTEPGYILIRKQCQTSLNVWSGSALYSTEPQNPHRATELVGKHINLLSKNG